MKIFSDIAGVPTLEARLMSIQKNAKKSTVENLKRSALEIHGTARKLIATTSSGEQVVRYNPKRKHVVSKPGDPPNSDTGRAISSVAFEINETSMEAVVGTNLKYLKWLEFGTRDVQARPWLSVAFKMFANKFKKIFKINVLE